MFITLKVLHLLALMFGSLAVLGNIYLAFSKGPHDLAAPDFTNKLRKMFRHSGLLAIILFWATGLALFITQYGGKISNPAFHAKLSFVILLTAIVLFTNYMAPKWAKRGGPPSYIPKLSWVSAIALIVSVVLAVITFA